MYPDGFSPVSLSLNYDGKGKAQHYSRTKRPPRYYLTDFSNAIHVTESPIHRSPSDAGQSVSELGSGSRVHEMGGLHNPFAFDIFCLGHFIKTEFVAVRFEFFLSAFALLMIKYVVQVWLRVPPVAGGQNDPYPTCYETNHSSCSRAI